VAEGKGAINEEANTGMRIKKENDYNFISRAFPGLGHNIMRLAIRLFREINRSRSFVEFPFPLARAELSFDPGNEVAIIT
jgi:hypothetical protein